MKLFLAILLLTVSAVANAIVDEVPNWTSIQVETIVDRKNVRVSARVRNDQLTSLKVRLAEATLDIPAKELVGLPTMRLQSLRIVSPHVKSGSGPEFSVELEGPQHLGEKTDKVLFIFSDKSYRGRVVEKNQGKERYRELKEPGHPPKPIK